MVGLYAQMPALLPMFAAARVAAPAVDASAGAVDRNVTAHAATISASIEPNMRLTDVLPLSAKGPDVPVHKQV